MARSVRCSNVAVKYDFVVIEKKLSLLLLFLAGEEKQKLSIVTESDVIDVFN